MLVNIKKNYFILIFTILFLYFFFNLLDGERGLISYFEKKTILKNLFLVFLNWLRINHHPQFEFFY